MIAVANQRAASPRPRRSHRWAQRGPQLGQRVLIVDLDPQACLTFSVGYDPESLSCSVHQLLVGQVAAEDAVLGTEEGRTCCLPPSSWRWPSNCWRVVRAGNNC